MPCIQTEALPLGILAPFFRDQLMELEVLREMDTLVREET